MTEASLPTEVTGVTPKPRRRWDPLDFVGYGLALISMAAVAVGGWGLWHRADAFGFLLRRDLSDFSSLLVDNHSHLALTTSVLYQLFYGVLGIDASLGYALPRIIGHAVLCVVIWRYLLWRGVNRHLALAALATLLVVGSSAYLYLVVVGGLLTHMCLAGIAYLMTTRGENPRPVDYVLLSVALVFCVVSNSVGVAALVGVTLVIVFAKPIRRLWPVVVPAFVVYGLWYVTMRPAGNGVGGWEAIAAVPEAVASLLATASARIAGLPLAFGAVLAVVVVAVVVRRFVGSMIGRAEWVYLATLGVFLGMVALLRSIPRGAEAAFLERYSYHITLLLLPALLPLLKIGRTALHNLAIWFVAAFAIAGNLIVLSSDLAVWVDVTTMVRDKVATVAALVDEGEPYLPDSQLKGKLFGRLVVHEVAEMEGANWPPPLTSNRRLIGSARAVLRFEVVAESVFDVSLRWHGLDPLPEDCRPLQSGDQLELLIVDAGSLRLLSRAPTAVQLVWADSFGHGSTREKILASSFAEYVEPETSATLTILNQGPVPLRVCEVPLA